MTVQQIEAFKRENDLAPDGESEPAGPGLDFDDEIDLRAEDDALIAAELEAEQAQAEAEPEEVEEEEEDAVAAGARRSRRGRRGRGGSGGSGGSGGGRRGGRGGTAALEGTFDHGEEGYGLWLDPAIEDNPIYAEHWAGHRPVEVTIEADRIVIRRSGDDDSD